MLRVTRFPPGTTLTQEWLDTQAAALIEVQRKMIQRVEFPLVLSPGGTLSSVAASQEDDDIGMLQGQQLSMITDNRKGWDEDTVTAIGTTG